MRVVPTVEAFAVNTRHVPISTLTVSALFLNIARAKTTFHCTEMRMLQVVCTHNFPSASNPGKRVKTLTFNEQKIIPPLVPVSQKKVVMLTHPRGAKHFPWSLQEN